MTEKQKGILLHNNFGICDQVKVKARDEGLARIKAIYNGVEHTVESDNAEVASYYNLTTKGPDYRTYLQDLYSGASQLGQEFSTFESFYPSDLGHYSLSFGSSIDWKLYGGGNFWQEYTGEYETTWTKQSAEKEDVLAITQKNINSTSSVLQLDCLMPASFDKGYDYTITVKQQGRTSRHLLNPRTHTTQIKVSCEHPISQRLLWS